MALNDEQMHQMVLFAQALTKIKYAAVTEQGVSLTAEEASVLLLGIDLIRPHPEKSGVDTA